MKEVKISELKMGPIRHKLLPEWFILKVKDFKEKLKEVENSSLEETIDNFKRDCDPIRELAIWEYIAESYELSLKDKPNLNIQDKKRLFGKILLSTMH